MVLKDRLDHLRGIVKTEKKVKVTELSQRFDVTEEPYAVIWRGWSWKVLLRGPMEGRC